MTVYHLLTLNYQTIPPSTHLKRETAKESEPKNCFRKTLHVVLQVTSEQKPHTDENRI